MTVDERVGTALHDLALGVRPLPDPVGRAYQRLQRSRRRRRTTMGIVAVLVMALAVPLAVRAQPAAVSAVAVWADRMTQEPRGPLGADRMFVASLETYVLQRVRDDGYPIGVPRQADADRQYDAVRVVFAADIASTRVALVALQLSKPGTRQYPDDALWLTAPAGSAAGTLAGEAGRTLLSQGLGPLETGHLDGGLTVAVAPAGCEFATAALPEIDRWTPEPTGSYLIRTPTTNRPEWWRVTCDGTVRVERPSMAPRTYDRDAAAVAAMSQRARGDRSDLTGAAYAEAAQSFGSEVYDQPAVVWTGKTPNVKINEDSPRDGFGTMLASRLVGEGWKLAFHLSFAQPNGGGFALEGQYSVTGDPFDGGSFIVLRPSGQEPSVVAIAPAGASRIRAVAHGATVDSAGVTDDSAVLQVPATVEATYEALADNGAVIGRTPLLEAGVRTGRPWIENWGFPVPMPTA